MSGFDPILFEKLAGVSILRDMPMSSLSSFRIGGPAKAYFEPRNVNELMLAYQTAKSLGIDAYIIGNGTNILVSDRGIDGFVIRVCEGMAGIKRTGDLTFKVGAGTLLSTLAKETLRLGCMGLEWAAGIPGALGGAIAMNAGAYGGEIRQALTRVDYIEDGELCSAAPAEGDMAYRHSVFAAPGRITVSAELTLLPDDGGAVERMKEYTARRREKQPLQYPSAGSVFKRPAGHFAGALIEEAGLKGFSVNGAQVSALHAGFIINTGNATCRDVMELIRIIKKRVYEHSGVTLTPELKFLGDFSEYEA